MGQKVIFISAIFPRSGTNFLNNILIRHPDCAIGYVGGEDFFLYHIDKLEVFLNGVNNRWREDWGNSINELKDEIVASLYRFITKGSDESKSHIITKTPFSRNLEKFGDYFEGSKLIIILRDGRDVLDSYINTFSPNFFRAVRLWAKGANELSEFLNSKNFLDYHIIKYEDLLSKTEIEVRKMLDYLELDQNTYPFASLNDMKVIGSSQVKIEDGMDKVNKEVEKTGNMKFTGRYQNWSWIRKVIFERFAGKVNRELGYF